MGTLLAMTQWCLLTRMEVLCREAELTPRSSRGKIERSADASKDGYVLYFFPPESKRADKSSE